MKPGTIFLTGWVVGVEEVTRKTITSEWLFTTFAECHGFLCLGMALVMRRGRWAKVGEMPAGVQIIFGPEIRI